MLNFVCLIRLFFIASLLSGAACGGKGASTGTAGTGGAGHGGTSGSSGGAASTSCPASMPTTQTGACSGSLNCQFNAGCTCHGCCMAFWSCVDGTFKQTDFNDGCGQGPPCEDGGAGTSGGSDGGGGTSGTGGAAGTDGPGAVCSPGADQTCNDNPILSSIHGHCTDAGTCTCTFDAGTNPDSGRCL